MHNQPIGSSLPGDIDRMKAIRRMRRPCTPCSRLRGETITNRRNGTTPRPVRRVRTGGDRGPVHLIPKPLGKAVLPLLNQQVKNYLEPFELTAPIRDIFSGENTKVRCSRPASACPWTEHSRPSRSRSTPTRSSARCSRPPHHAICERREGAAGFHEVRADLRAGGGCPPPTRKRGSMRRGYGPGSKTHIPFTMIGASSTPF